MAARKKKPPRSKKPPPRQPPPEAPPRAEPGTGSAEPTAASSALRPEFRAPGSGRVPVVGIGASAGGLDAFKKFFAHMPADSGLAFVLVPHLDPNHASLMAELLGRHTAMPVVEAADNVAVEANRVYVIPPNRDLALRGGRLRLSRPAEPRGRGTSIDSFFRSLAADLHEQAVGIVLSGTGTHGTLGLQAVKANGGLVMAQDPATAEHEQMPRSAINAGLADYVLPPEQMPEAIVQYAHHFYVNGGAKPPDEGAADHLNQILAVLHARLKVDFRCYRKRMLARRVERRMSLKHLDEMPAYLALLREQPDEARQLAKDLLISVTGFFRDPELYHLLGEQVFPEIIRRKNPGATVRVWVPGCATGEEAYSLTMVLLEQLAAAQKNLRLQVFASDIDEDALAAARHGVYPESITADVSAERLARFFTRADETSFEVAKQLREPIVFAAQNLVQDPPFSKLDVISCRNVLIYLEPETQRRGVPLLHFALNDDGTLVLGPSETIGRHADLFESVSKKWRVYRRVGNGRPEHLDFPGPRGREAPAPAARAGEAPAGPRPNFAELTTLALLEEFAAAAVLINRKNEILYYHGQTGRFLEAPPGEPTQDLLRLTREGLRPKLRAAVHKAATERQRVSTSRVRVKHDGSTFWARATVRPLVAPRGPEGLLLVVLEEDREAPRPGDGAPPDEALERHLENELQAVRQDLQTTIEELESSNEELKSSNEEVMSMNEELQSANEELETSKEELQSLNEELTTVNGQFQDKIAELELTNNDLANLLSSTDIATVFLDTSFRVKRFTPATTKLLSLLATDVDRPIDTFARRFSDGDLLADCRAVLETLTPREREIHTDDGRVCLRRVLPYRTLDNKIEGVVLTFTDVTALRQALERQRLLAAVLLNSSDAVVVRDLSGRITVWNHSAEQMYGYTEAEALGMRGELIVPPPLRAVSAEMFERLKAGESPHSWETQRLCKDGRVLDVWATRSVLKDEAGHPTAVASLERDITERKRAEQTIRELNATLERRIAERTAELRDSNQRLATILATAAEGVITFAADRTIDSFNRAAERIFGYAAAEVLGRKVDALIPAPYPAEQAGRFADYLAPGAGKAAGPRRVLGRRKDGSTFPMELSVSEMRDGRALYTVIVRDVSESLALEREVLEVAAAEQRRIGQDLHDSVGQELTGLGLMAEGLAEALPDKSQPAAQAAQKIADAVRRALKQVRALSRGLTPVEVDAEGLMLALAELAERTRDTSPAPAGSGPGRNCTFVCEEPVLVEDTRTATHLYHIAQEAVANALKHSQARKIEIRLAADERSLTLSVRDDGVGPPERPDDSRGMGLKIMGYRAGLIGATLSVAPAPGGGTVVRCVAMRGVSHAD
jgi:two-component system CheB/CheR fusion protein